VGERDEYRDGTFCWAELSSTDQEAAKAFYGALLGWQAEDVPTGEEHYSLQLVDGMRVAAIAPQPPQQRGSGVPSMWNSYVSVSDADAVAARARELGADVHAGPFDVFSAGRMAVIQDPQGAYFMLWQAGETIGAGLVNAPGALVWNELQSPDLDASASFYGDLLGWGAEEAPSPQGRYLTIVNGGAYNGGMRELTPPAPPSWLVYFGVEDVERALAKAGELGARTLAGPIDIEMARIAVVMDPQGAVFALYAGHMEP